MHWLLQGNPKRYRVLDAIEDSAPLANWSVGRYRDEFQAGDDIVLWISGKEAGVYGFGRVTGSAVWFDGDADDDYWEDSEDAGRGRWVMPIALTTVNTSPIVSRADLKAHPVFSQSLIIRNPNATNPFRLTDEEWQVIRAAAGIGHDAPGRALRKRPAAGGGTGQGGGGEGPLHAALKDLIKRDPAGTVGEPLTFEAEDLVEALGAEVRFITGDRVDLLMRDANGAYVVIEVEPVIGPADHIGFHQAGKYRVLVAMDRGLPVEKVRAMVAATTIDPALRDHYAGTYDIEWREVPNPL
jgi:predicted RNA-binding protein with PUA-like domain